MYRQDLEAALATFLSGDELETAQYVLFKAMQRYNYVDFAFYREEEMTDILDDALRGSGDSGKPWWKVEIPRPGSGDFPKEEEELSL